MIKDGVGGGNTKTGLVFESKADLKTLLNGLKDYRVDKNGVVFFKKMQVGIIFVKHDLYRFLEQQGINYKDHVSKKFCRIIPFMFCSITCFT